MIMKKKKSLLLSTQPIYLNKPHMSFLLTRSGKRRKSQHSNSSSIKILIYYLELGKAVC